MLKSKIRPLLRLTEKGFEPGFEDIAADDRSLGGADTEVAGVTKTNMKTVVELRRIIESSPNHPFGSL